MRQNDLVAQIRIASDRAVESERLRRGALQEAAFFRAKVATLESNSPIDLARIEKERINELERQLGALHAEHSNAQRELDRINGDSSSSRDLHTAAVQREAETLKRAEDAEEAHRQAVEELEELQVRVKMAETSMREHSERLVSLSSAAQQREAERDRLQTQLDEASTQRDGHLALIEQVQAAVAAAGARSVELESHHEKAAGRIEELERELAETKLDLETKTRDAETARERIAEVENAYAKSREEADSLRNVTTSHLGELLESHKSLRADDTRAVRGHQDQVRALEEEGNSLRRMLKEAGQRLDAAESGVSHHRQKARNLEIEHQSLRGEMRAHRTKLLSAQQELNRYKEMHGAKDQELRDRDLAVTEIETRCNMLRNLCECLINLLGAELMYQWPITGSQSTTVIWPKRTRRLRASSNLNYETARERMRTLNARSKSSLNGVTRLKTRSNRSVDWSTESKMPEARLLSLCDLHPHLPILIEEYSRRSGKCSRWNRSTRRRWLPWRVIIRQPSDTSRVQRRCSSE